MPLSRRILDVLDHYSAAFRGQRRVESDVPCRGSPRFPREGTYTKLILEKNEVDFRPDVDENEPYGACRERGKALTGAGGI